MADTISAPPSKGLNPQRITGTDFTDLDSNEKRALDINLGSCNGEMYMPNRKAIKIVNRDVGHNAAVPIIERILGDRDIDFCELYDSGENSQVLAFYQDGGGVVDIQITYTATGWKIQEYTGSLLDEDGFYILDEDGFKILQEG
jgi:hypothetical protein